MRTFCSAWQEWLLAEEKFHFRKIKFNLKIFFVLLKFQCGFSFVPPISLSRLVDECSAEMFFLLCRVPQLPRLLCFWTQSRLGPVGALLNAGRRGNKALRILSNSFQDRAIQPVLSQVWRAACSHQSLPQSLWPVSFLDIIILSYIALHNLQLLSFPLLLW